MDCTGTYTVELKQPRWGAFGKFGSMWAITHTYFELGDGSTVTDISHSKGHLRLEYSGFNALTNAAVTLGTKDGTYGYPREPFMIEWYNSGGTGADYGWISPGIGLLECNLYNIIYCNTGSNTRFQLWSADTEIKRFTAPPGSLYYFYFRGGAGAGTYSDIFSKVFQYVSGVPEWNDLIIKGESYAFFYSGPTANTPDVATRLVRPELEGNTYDIAHYSRGNGIVVVDPVNPLVTSKLGGNMSQVGWTYRLWLYYTMNLKVVDTNGTAVSGATVTLKNKDDTEQFSVSTDASGDIVTKEVLAALWSHDYDGGGWKHYTDAEKTDYNDFTIEIKKAGYKTYKKKFTLNSKTDWTIALQKVLDNNFSKRVNINNY